VEIDLNKVLILLVYLSIVVSVTLHCAVVDHIIGIDNCLVRRTISWKSLHRGAIKVDLVVYNEKRVVGIHDIVVDTDTIQVLLQKTLEEHVFLLQCSLLLINSKPIEENLVETFVELIE
jgi:hypothetical protein